MTTDGDDDSLNDLRNHSPRDFQHADSRIYSFTARGYFYAVLFLPFVSSASRLPRRMTDEPRIPRESRCRFFLLLFFSNLPHLPKLDLPGCFYYRFFRHLPNRTMEGTRIFSLSGSFGLVVRVWDSEISAKRTMTDLSFAMRVYLCAIQFLFTYLLMCRVFSSECSYCRVEN